MDSSVAAGTTGLSQAVAGLALALQLSPMQAAGSGLPPSSAGAPAMAPSSEAPPGGAAAVPAPPGLAPAPTAPTIALRQLLFGEWVEQEVLAHFALIQAGASGDVAVRDAPVALPTNWASLQMILGKLAYATGDTDPWRQLGLARFEGPLPSEQLIAARLRTAAMLCDMALASPMPDAERLRAQASVEGFRAAAATCEQELLGVLAERRKLRMPSLPLWKELGTAAVDLLRSTAGSGAPEALLTQWSSILPGAASSATDVDEARRLSELCEKGDAKVWGQLKGRAVVAWAPGDAGSLARLLSSLLRIASPEQRPSSLRLVAPVGLISGMSNVVGVTDLWSHPLLGDKWAPLVRSQTFCTQPMEMVLPGRNQPRHVAMGLAVFGIAVEGPRLLPRMVEVKTPLFEIAPSMVSVVDMPADYLPRFMSGLAASGITDILARHHRRSPGSLPDAPRVCVDLVFPAGCTELDAIAAMEGMRRSPLPHSVCFALNTIYDSREAMILEMTDPRCIQGVWPLCSQFVFLTGGRALVTSHAASETWVAVMDQLCRHDPQVAATRLRWRPSAHGGRPVATPSATAASLAASQRRGRTGGSTAHMTDIVVRGELGAQDGQVLGMLMQHVTTQVGITVKHAGDQHALRPGEFFALRERDPHAQPGRVRVLLRSTEEVRKLHAVLHGQLIRVGSEQVRVEVVNDAMDALRGPGNSTGARA